MDAIKALMTRRSIRKFKDTQVPDAILKEIIRVGTYAPSALDLQPWSFIVIQDQELLKRISDYCKPIMLSHLKDAGDEMNAFRELLKSSDFSTFYHAPTIIMVTGKTSDRFREIDCSLCAGNMILAAHSLGLGSCWIGSTELAFGNQDLMAACGIPEGYSPICTIAFGYPAEIPEVPFKKDPLVTWIR